MKKTLKWIAIALGVLLIILISAPFLFKNKIKSLIINSINKNIEATINFDDVDISLLKNFPKASVNISKLALINKAPFEGDTLVYVDNISLKMSVKELFKDENEAMQIEAFSVDNSLINILFNQDGIGNFDIALKEDTTEEDKSEESNFMMSLQKYEINNMRFVFFDQKSNMKFVLDSIVHKGKGNFKNAVVDLDTYTSAVASFDMDKSNFLNRVPVKLDAVLNLDLENAKYTFKENLALIQKLPLEFDGFIQLQENGQQYDITFNTPTTSFANFLAIIPSAYSGSLDNVKTSGDFAVKGFAKGILSDETIPTFSIAIISKNASFQYPDLPKGIQQINIDTKINNDTGLLKDTYINLDKLSFKIDQDVFNAKAKLQNITENMLVDAYLNGVINLANLSKAYPIKLEQALSGIIKADVALNLDMLSVENQKYENVKATGNLNLTGFEYKGAELAKPLTINLADLNFSPAFVSLNKFDAKTGNSDLNLQGRLDNFYGFIFKNQILKANFSFTSNHLEVGDFMTQTQTTTTTQNTSQTTTTEAFKVPAFLDCTFNAKANTVIYDNLTLTDVNGKLIIKDQTITLSGVNTAIFGGKIALDGSVSTKSEKPSFDMNLNLNTLDIFQAFSKIEMLEKIAPITNVLSGKLNATVKLDGLLDPLQLTPDLNAVSGDLFGQLIAPKVDASKSELLTSLSSNFNFINLNNLNLNNLKTHLNFKNGKVNVNPINLKYQDIALQISGNHGFDQNINYNLSLDVPAKYLGKDAANLLSSLSNQQLQSVVIPVKSTISGSFSKPHIQTDMKQSMQNLSNQIIANQKNELLNKGKDALNQNINNLIGKDSVISTIPTTKDQANQIIEQKKAEVQEQVKQKAQDALKGFLNKNK